MKKNLLNNSKKVICFCLFSSGVLLSGNAWSQDSVQDTIKKAADDSLKNVAAAGFIPVKIPVLYGEQSKDRLVQSISFLNGKKLENAPVSLLSNSFAGQLSGLYSNQTNGAPRFDNPNLSLRGRTPLIVIDGVPRYNLIDDGNQTLYDVLSINPEQVESITLLKDALSTAMLGNRGMNGVLMVTTKSGDIEKKPVINVTAQAGTQTPIGMRKALSSYDYASLYNEASVNSGGSPVYTSAQLDAYKNGSDPFLYPDVDWRKALLKDNAISQRYNINASGNYANIKYFMSLDYQSQGGLLQENPSSKEQTNVDYKRYIFRANLDIKLDSRLSANLNLLGNIQDYIQPGVGSPAVINSIFNTPNNATPIYNANGSFAGTRIYPTNPYAQSTGTGHLQNNLQAGSLDLGLKRMMDDVVKGSWIKATLSYSPSYEQQLDRSLNYDAYNFPVPGDTTQHLLVNTKVKRAITNAVIERFQQTYLELSMGIDRNWNKNAFTGILMGNYDNGQGNNTLNQVNKGISTRLAYSFDKRFNLEVAAAYNGNNWFAPGNQFDFYPSAGASWNIHNERFFKGIKFLNELKLRGSYGKVGNANPGYYLFQQSYTGGTAYVFGNGATSAPTIYEGALASLNRVAEKADKLNIGLDLAYSNQHGWLNFDYYNNLQYDLLQIRGNNSVVLGQVFPLENIGRNRYYGIEVNTGWTDKIGEFTYSLSGNFSTVNSRIIFNDEPAQAYSYLAKTGGTVNQIRGYVADGFFNSGNLNTATMPGFVPSPGDVKYKDLNNDGTINSYDQTIIGNNKPLLFYGANLSLRFKGFDMNVLFQGVANRDIVTQGDYELPFANKGIGQAYQYNLNRYTPQTASTATLPRVTLGNDVNNYVVSSLYVRNASFIRLKNAELGYTFGRKLPSSAKIKGVRLFVNGQNLITFSKYKESDPENYTGLYPLQRIINGGISVKL